MFAFMDQSRSIPSKFFVSSQYPQIIYSGSSQEATKRSSPFHLPNCQSVISWSDLVSCIDRSLARESMTSESTPSGNKHDLVDSSDAVLFLSESPTRKRQRRSKQDPQFVFDGSAAEQNDSESKSTKQSPSKTKPKPLRTVESLDSAADLYEPGDIVWCKLGSFPWWPALIVRRDLSPTVIIFLLFRFLVSVWRRRRHSYQSVEYVPPARDPSNDLTCWRF